MINIANLIDEQRCYEKVRMIRWPEMVVCVQCGSINVTKNGKHKSSIHRQRYECQDCTKKFDDLTSTIFAGSHIPLKTWLLSSYFMGLNLSNSQIADELDINKETAHNLCTKLREGIVIKKEVKELENEVEFDEVYVVAGHKGLPEEVLKKERKARPRRLKGKRGRGTLKDEKVPILGMIQRDGEVVIKMLPNVQIVTIEPIIKTIVKAGTLIYTDEYSIYNKLENWGYEHKTVNHSAGQYAIDEDGDGFCEVHVNTMEGFWSLLRSWLRPHRGVSQNKLPFYIGAFEFFHNCKKRGKKLFGSILTTLLNPDKRTTEEYLNFEYIK